MILDAVGTGFPGRFGPDASWCFRTGRAVDEQPVRGVDLGRLGARHQLEQQAPGHRDPQPQVGGVRPQAEPLGGGGRVAEPRLGEALAQPSVPGVPARPTRRPRRTA